MFCDEPGCDCRRVMFYVVSRGRSGPIAVVAYGWESVDFYARWLKSDDPRVLAELMGPVLNMGSHQSNLAPAILGFVRDRLLQDAAYVQRVKRHYEMFRKKIDCERTPTPPKRRGARRKRRMRRKR